MLTKLKKTLELSKTYQVTNNSHLKITFLATPSLCLCTAHLDAHLIVIAGVVSAVKVDMTVDGSGCSVHLVNCAFNQTCCATDQFMN